MIVFDAETDNLLDKVTVIHCIAVYDRDTGNVERYRDVKGHVPAHGTIEDGLRRIANADCIGGHNVHGYDIPVFQKLYPGKFFPTGTVRDSLVEAEMWYPANDLRVKDFAAQKKYNNSWISGHLYGRHSLEAWGERLKCPKDEYTKWCKDQGLSPWSEWRPEMEDYCVQDTITNARLFDYLEESFDYEGAAAAVALENKVAPILFRQEQWGVTFNLPRAAELHTKLVARHMEIADELRRDFFGPFYLRNGKAVTPKRNLNYKDKLRPDLTADATYVKVKLVEFNPASRQHIYKRLMALYGWEPTKFTPSGEPQVDESVIETLPYPPCKLINEYLLLEKRLGQLAEGNQAWLRKEKDGVIHGRVKANGTRTSRCSHVNPNMGQVPKVTAPFGTECRALFGPRKGRKQMGCDLSGIEMRAQGHYLYRYDGGAFAAEVINGDVHTIAKEAMGFNSRDITKTFEYAMTYGAGLPKLGAVVYEDMTDEQKKEFGKVSQRKLAQLGKARKQLLETGLKGFDKLLKAVKGAHTRGWMRALDGRKLAVPSEHSALNTLFQGFGGVVAKQWIVLLNDKLVENGLIPADTWYIDMDNIEPWKVVQILFVHDEVQTDCEDGYEKQAGELAVEAAREAGRVLKLNVALDAEAKIGADWSECH